MTERPVAMVLPLLRGAKMKITYSPRSEKAMKGIHPDLVKVLREYAKDCEMDLIVTEGLRTPERQKELVSQGASRTLKSRHITGHAFDIVGWIVVNGKGQISYSGPVMKVIAVGMKAAAKRAKVKIEWGGDWTSFVDQPHYQLPKAEYPA